MKNIILAIIVVFAFIACETQLEENTTSEKEKTEAEEVLPQEKEDPETYSWERMDTGAEEYYPEINIYASDNAVLKGWIEEKELFGTEEKRPFFRVAEDSLQNLPDVYQDIEFYQIEEDMVRELQGYDQNNPATVIATEVRSVWEGIPKMTISLIK
jgi:hypothetical protein